MKARKLIGTIISVIGFLAIFGETEQTNLQLLWTIGAAAVMYLGYRILEPTLEED